MIINKYKSINKQGILAGGQWRKGKASWCVTRLKCIQRAPDGVAGREAAASMH